MKVHTEMTKKHIKRHSIIMVVSEIKTKNTVRYHFINPRILIQQSKDLKPTDYILLVET